MTTAGSDGHQLVVQSLRAGVTSREVLAGIDLVVGSGEVHAVMGPNGSGKSTLAHVLMGRPGYQVLGGSVTLDGHDLLGLPAWQRARLGLFLAPQYPTEIPGVGLQEMLAEALVATGHAPVAGSGAGSATDRAAVEAQRVGLETKLLDRPVNVDLSGGERKRSETLQLAVLRPHIAVLDELDSGLDVDGLRDVAQRVRAGVGEWGLGVLAITHYQRLLTVLRPDVVHVLVGGRIVASGGPEMAEELERTGYAQYITPGDVRSDAGSVRRPGFTEPAQDS
ncbi:MAG TPA: Fe-S cluster assembly ATPase SufC [Acidimicrobiales bacterium]|nr:Fe-S cluster assembly ATPase SufC [Acidimicrobiales bacterium]